METMTTSDVADTNCEDELKIDEDPQKSPMRCRRVHPVWEHFDIIDSGMKCLLCGRTFKTTGSTTVCKHHLRSRHPDVHAQLEAEDRDWRTKTAQAADNGDAAETNVKIKRTKKSKQVSNSSEATFPVIPNFMDIKTANILKSNNNIKMEYADELKQGAPPMNPVSSSALDIFANLLNQPQIPMACRKDMSSTSVECNGRKIGVDTDTDDPKDESSPLGCLVVDLHRKLRDTNKLHKALEFKKDLFHLLSEYESELL